MTSVTSLKEDDAWVGEEEWRLRLEEVRIPSAKSVPPRDGEVLLRLVVVGLGTRTWIRKRTRKKLLGSGWAQEQVEEL